MAVAPDPELSRRVAIVGVGETNYAEDYRKSRAKEPGYELPEPESLAAVAFDRALADSGLRRDQIDGLSVSFTYGGPDPNTMADAMGIKPRYAVVQGGIMAGVIPPVVTALVKGECDTVAMVYAVASSAIGRQFGGETYRGGRAPVSYYYYHPWGWSSQAAHWAVMFRYYQSAYGASEEDLGSVATTIRCHAQLNDNAIMRAPMTIQDYLESRYIVRPIRLFDMCLVNDGGVCLIMRRNDMAREAAHPPVLVAGWGDSEVHRSKLHYMIREGLRTQLQEAGAQAFAMAGLSLSDIYNFQGYDASSFHLIAQMEGYGLVNAGDGLEFCKAGEMQIGGKLPVKTSGGMLSEAYMQGWNHVAEAVRQLRHEAGARQVTGIETSMFSLATTQSAHPLILTRQA